MTWFGRSSGYYLFWTGFVYFCLGMFDIFVYRFCPPELLSALWVCILLLPLTVPSVARHFNMEPTMFDFFRRKTAKEYMDEASNVYNLPKPKLVPPMPKVEPPAPKEPEAKIFYRIGVTDKHRVAFSMGHMEITMNKRGCQQMIDQLTVFMNQLEDEDE